MASESLQSLPLPDGITCNHVQCPQAGLTIHYLEAGYDPSNPRPLILLIHGFPELAFTWRKVMPALASAGHHVVAYDQRGYGRTTGWDADDTSQWTFSTLVKDAVILVHALGHKTVRCVVGHDFGAVTASLCALTRPDLFTSLVMMSHPYKPQPALPFDYAHSLPPTSDTIPSPPSQSSQDIQSDLATLSPPRKHYKYYNSTPSASTDWSTPPQGLQSFLRGYFHVKSGHYHQNTPSPLSSWTAPALAKMPHYYIMPLALSMPATIAAMMQDEDPKTTTSWLPDEELDVYVREWTRTGFKGGLNWYRTATQAARKTDLLLWAGRRIECPAVFVSGERDWGNCQEPGALEGLEVSCKDFRGVKLIEGAGHWVQQEKPGRVVEEVLRFLGGL